MARKSKITGKIIVALPERSGVTSRGEWKSQEFVIETFDTYPKKCVFQVFGEEKLSSFDIKLNETLKVSFNIDAHEYNGRYFNSLMAYNVERITSSTQAFDTGTIAAPSSKKETLSAAVNSVATDSDNEDDLPF